MSAGNRKRRRELGLLPDPARCVARKRDGTPCRGRPIAGASVCRMHGGSAPQVQRKAAERIANASDVAVMKLLALMQDPDVPKAVQAAVARDLLDRANVSGKTTVEVEVKPWEKLLDGIIAELPTDGEAAPAMRPFAEAQDEEALKVASERFEAETVAAAQAETTRVLESYREENQDRSRRPPQEPGTPPGQSQPRDGNPPQPRPRWERDAEAERLRRLAEFADDVEHPPPHGEDYRRATPRPPRRGRVAGRR